MLKQSYVLTVGQDEREMLSHPDPAFPCSLFHRDLNDYAGGSVIPHWHEELELCFLERGRLTLHLLNASYPMEEGDFYFLNANRLHSLTSDTEEPCIFLSAVFSPSLLSGAASPTIQTKYIRPYLTEGPDVIFLRRDPEGKKVLREAMLSMLQGLDGAELRFTAALSGVFLSIREESLPGAPRLRREEEKRVKDMLSWLNRRLSEKISMKDLASDMGLSLRECQRCFSKYLKLSPSEYLLRRRITIAGELLSSGDGSITEISLQTGFESPSYFSKQFRRLTGLSPSEYRKKGTMTSYVTERKQKHEG